MKPQPEMSHQSDRYFGYRHNGGKNGILIFGCNSYLACSIWGIYIGQVSMDLTDNVLGWEAALNEKLASTHILR